MAEVKLRTSEVSIPVGSISLKGNLSIPERAQSIVVFSHGSGSSRHSVRNKYVAEYLNSEGLATLMFDLLTESEDKNYSNRFDIEMMVQRLLLVTDWIKEKEDTAALDVGYFGSSTGAASALGAASMLGELVKAVVSRGGRPDLAAPYLQDVKAPTLLIVGSRDYPVIEMNEQAYAMMPHQAEIKIVKDATHLFEEPGKLEEVAKIAAAWFKRFMKH